MESFGELCLASRSLSGILQVLRTVVTAGNGWRTDEEKNEDYSRNHGSECFWLIPPAEPSGLELAIAFASEERRGKARMSVPNIIPLSKSELTICEYNLALQRAHEAIIATSPKRGGVSVKFRNGEIVIEDIVPGRWCRERLDAWLGGYPTTFHPLDLERLDFFISAVYARQPSFDVGLFGRWLIERENWQPAHARIVIERITIGLQVLRANRVFWRGR